MLSSGEAGHPGVMRAGLCHSSSDDGSKASSPGSSPLLFGCSCLCVRLVIGSWGMRRNQRNKSSRACEQPWGARWSGREREQAVPAPGRQDLPVSVSFLRFTIPHSQDLLLIRLTENRTYTPMLSCVCGGRKHPHATLKHCCESENRVHLFATPRTIQSTEFSKLEY